MRFKGCLWVPENEPCNIYLKQLHISVHLPALPTLLLEFTCSQQGGDVECVGTHRLLVSVSIPGHPSARVRSVQTKEG